jgi:outer membrane protein
VLPQLNASAGVTGDHNAGTQPFFGTNPNGTPFVVAAPATIDTTTRQWSVNLRQNVFSWSNWMALKAAGREVAQAEANYQAAEQQLILRVAQAYFNVLAAEDGLEANQASLEAISRQLEQANKRFEVGLIAITDVEDAKAAHDTAAAAVIAAKRTLATSEDQLQEITGQKYDRLAKPGADMPLKNPEPADESRWVDISLEQNLSLIASRLAAEIARDNARAAIGGHLPTLDVVAGRTYQNQGVDEVFAGLPFAYDTYFNDRQLGLQFTLPIFSGGAAQSRVRETQYRWIAAKEAVVQSSRATERQARDAYLGVIAGIARVRALRQALESNQTALRATEAGYEVGTRTSVDVLNARRLLVQAQTDYSGSRYDYIVSVLQLRLAAGNLDRAQLSEINTYLTLAAPTSPAVETPETLSPTVPQTQGAPTAPPGAAPSAPAAVPAAPAQPPAAQPPPPGGAS